MRYRCSACGFEYDLAKAPFSRVRIYPLADSFGFSLRNEFAVDVRIRPDELTWSILEYGCHVRDVLLARREQVLLARQEECPTVIPIRWDERVTQDNYADQDPRDVARQLLDAAHLFADAMTRIPPEDWDRTLAYEFPPTDVQRSLRWLAIDTVHELHHHDCDVRWRGPRIGQTEAAVPHG